MYGNMRKLYQNEMVNGNGSKPMPGNKLPQPAQKPAVGNVGQPRVGDVQYPNMTFAQRMMRSYNK